MGVYEIITGITENEENLKVEIRQTEGTMGGNLVYIKNTKTNKAYSFTLADGDEYGADAMTRNAVAKLHSGMCGCNEKTLDRIEHALGIKLETWQSEYILSEGITYPYEGRRTGKTLAYQIKTLLIAHNDITIYGNEAQYYVDEIHGSIYEKNYVTDLARLSEHLRKAGIEVPKVTLKLDKMRRREGSRSGHQ